MWSVSSWLDDQPLACQSLRLGQLSPVESSLLMINQRRQRIAKPKYNISIVVAWHCALYVEYFMWSAAMCSYKHT